MQRKIFHICCTFVSLPKRPRVASLGFELKTKALLSALLVPSKLLMLMRGCPRDTIAPWSIRPLNWERCIFLFSCKRCPDMWSGHTLRSFCQFGNPTYWYSRGFLKNILPLSLIGSSRAFYSVWSLVALKVGKTLWLSQSWWCSEGGRVIIILQAADRDCWGGREVICHLTCLFTLQAA